MLVIHEKELLNEKMNIKTQIKNFNMWVWDTTKSKFVGIRKLKQVEVKVLELEETMENLARQLKEANSNKDILLDENRKGKKVLEKHERQIKEL